jgi:hypothetical protein
VRDAAQIVVDGDGRRDADEGRAVSGARHHPQLRVADPGERRVGPQQTVHVPDDERVPGRGHALQFAGERTALVAVLHGCPQRGAGE